MSRKDSDTSMDALPGWIPGLDLQDLVQMVQFEPRREPSTSKNEENERAPSMQGGPLLAGRNLQISLSPTRSPAASAGTSSSEPAAVTQIPVTAAPARTNKGWLLKLGIAAVVAVGLAIFAWAVMQSSDYSEVAVVKGERFDDDHLAVELGETLPAFSGLLLVDDPASWGDTFSDQDLVGKNTLLFVWGSWNEELVAWSQDLNYIRLVNFENKAIRFLGLNLDAEKDDALTSLNDDLSKWPHLFNGDDRIEEEARPMFRLGIHSSPLILLIDATGRLRAEGLEPDEVVEVYQELFELN